MSRFPEPQIDQVITHLLPETAFEHQFGPPSRLAERMTYYKTPGVSIAVIHDDTIVWARGFGIRTWGTSEPVQEHTRFQAASISKPIFALAVMRLVQEGQLDLDADVNTYLTTWQVPASADWQPRITLRQLLSHSAGLSVHGFPGYLRSEPLPNLPQILDGQPPANTAAVRVNILPATQFRYSGGGNTVAQQLVVDVLGKPFPQIMRELILDPLEMHDSTYAQPLPQEWEALASTAHPWQYQQVEGGWHVYPEMAAAGLWTTPTDLAKVGLALQRIRRGAPGGILVKETLEQMLTPQIGEEMGLGFFLHGEGAGAWFGHGGWDEGFIAAATFAREGSWGAVVMINSNQGEALVAEIMRAIAQTYGWPGYVKSTPATAAVHTQVLKAYEGTYTLREGVACVVEQRDGALWLRAAAQAPLRLTPASETEFFTILNTRVAFERAGEGTVTGMTLRQDGTTIIAKKTG